MLHYIASVINSFNQAIPCRHEQRPTSMPAPNLHSNSSFACICLSKTQTGMHRHREAIKSTGTICWCLLCNTHLGGVPVGEPECAPHNPLCRHRITATRKATPTQTTCPHWMPAQRAMSIKFSPPTTLLAKRSAKDVPYATFGTRLAIVLSTRRSKPNTACPHANTSAPVGQPHVLRACSHTPCIKAMALSGDMRCRSRSCIRARGVLKSDLVGCGSIHECPNTGSHV